MTPSLGGAAAGALGVVLPVPDPNCPGLDKGGSILDSIGGIIDHIPIIGDVKKVAEMIGGIAKAILGWISDPGSMSHDIGGWFTFNVFGYNVDAPNCYQPTSGYGFARSVLLGDVRLGASPVYHDAYTALMGAGFVLVFLAAMGRVVRSASGPEHHLGRTLVDVIPRVVLGLAGITLGFAALDFVLPLCTEVGGALLGQLASVAVGGSPSQLGDPLGLALFGGVQNLAGLGLLAVVLLPVLLFFLIRVLAMLVARFLIVSMGIAFTPIMIAIAVYDHRAPVVRWWLSLMGGAAITPIVCAAMLGITLGLSVRFAQGDQSGTSFAVGPLLGAITAIGGLWLTGKTIRALLFNSTGGHHQGTMAFIRHSAETMLSVPMAAAAVLGPGKVAAALPGSAGKAFSALAARRGMNDSGGKGAQGASVGTKPSTAFAAFRSSPAGMAVAQAATPGLAPGTAPGARWAHLLGSPQLSRATERLQGAAFAEMTRTGEPVPAEADRRAFVAAARTIDVSPTVDVTGRKESP